jgi:DNA-binding XRE family transcriptional regulator
MFMLQDRMTLLLDVRNRTLTLIEREDDTRSLGNFLVYFSHNVVLT